MYEKPISDFFFFFYNYFIFAGHESERINSSLAVLIITDNRTDMFNRVLSVCLNLTYVLDSKALSYIQDFFFSHLIFSFFFTRMFNLFLLQFSYFLLSPDYFFPFSFICFPVLVELFILLMLTSSWGLNKNC